MYAQLTITPTTARRLAITKQRLAGPLPKRPDKETIYQVIQALGCLQLDPISAVARSHLLVLWSRLGQYDRGLLDTLLWEEKRLFEYWAHCASIVLTEDYPLHLERMNAYRAGKEEAITWLQSNGTLVAEILAAIDANGPLSTQHFADSTPTTAWYSSGWTSGRTINRVFDYLWLQGDIMVARRTGTGRLWARTAQHLPPWTPREPLDPHMMVRTAAQRSLRTLGVARPNHIRQHFIRGRYPELPAILAELMAEDMIIPVAISGEGATLPGPWYVHRDDLPLLEALAAGEAWQPRTTLLSPFDNLICDRARTELLFDFTYRVEIYVPPAQRTFGYYVLPILHGDRLIGRIDPIFDRKAQQLVINTVYTEEGAPHTKTVGRAVTKAIAELAAFVGARDIVYRTALPTGWV